MSQYPWTPETELSTDQVAALIRSQFTGIACRSVRLLGEGWDFFVFVIDDELAFRFPKRAMVAKCSERELRLLERLATDLPIDVPRPLYLGQPGQGYLWPFWGYRMLKGEPLGTVTMSEQRQCDVARLLGEFLSRLHLTDGAGLPASPWFDDDQRPWQIKIQDRLQASRDAYPAALFSRCLEFVQASERVPTGYRGTRRQVHGDLLADHILVNPATFRPTGIIDWGDPSTGDPAGDFVGIWMWGGDQVLKVALGSYRLDLDSAARERIRYHGTLVAMEDIFYAAKTNLPGLLKSGLTTLERELLR